LGGVGNTHVSVLIIRRHVLSLVSFGVPPRGASLGRGRHHGLRREKERGREGRRRESEVGPRGS
jgi:hypothetical protein